MVVERAKRDPVLAGFPYLAWWELVSKPDATEIGGLDPDRRRALTAGEHWPAEVPSSKAEAAEFTAGALFRPLRLMWGEPIRVVSALGDLGDLGRPFQAHRGKAPGMVFFHLALRAEGYGYELAPADPTPARILELYGLATLAQEFGHAAPGGLAVAEEGESILVDVRRRRARWGRRALDRLVEKADAREPGATRWL